MCLFEYFPGVHSCVYFIMRLATHGCFENQLPRKFVRHHEKLNGGEHFNLSVDVCFFMNRYTLS